jgi:hypothetical protein
MRERVDGSAYTKSAHISNRESVDLQARVYTAPPKLLLLRLLLLSARDHDHLHAP